MMDLDGSWLVKHSTIECGRRWWFLDEIYSLEHWKSCTLHSRFPTKDLKTLKDLGLARFLRRYESEEELEIDVVLKYGSNCKLKDLDFQKSLRK